MKNAQDNSGLPSARLRRIVLMATGCTAALAISTSAYAQSADAQNAAEDPGASIVVTGIRASIDNAIQAKRLDTRVTDGISAEDLGKFPSQNITEAIQRISGVQMSNINGRGATISVRGLGPQYALTTVNGQTFKTADFTDGFRYDIIQTELANSIQVIKSPTADMDAGGLSGTVNIETTKPLNYHDRQIVLTAKGQNSEYAGGKITPKISGSYVDQFADGTLGVYLNVGYQKLQDRADYVWMDRWWTNNIGGSTLTPRRLRYRRIDRTTEQLMASGGVQWKPTDNLEVMATAIWARDKTEYDLNQQVFFFNNSPTASPSSSVTANKVVDGVSVDTTANNLQLENNRQHEDRKLTSQGYTLSTKWTGDNGWTVRGVGNYTRGNTYWREDAAVLGIYVPTANINIEDPNNIILTTGSTNLSDPAIYAPANLYRNDYPSGATRLMSSREVSGQVDISKELELGPIKKLTVGAKYRDENFNRYITRHDLNQLKVNGTYPGPATTIFPALSTANISVNDFMNGEFSMPHSWVAPDIAAWAAGLKASGLTIADFYAPEGSYGVNRYMASAYFMGDIDTMIAGMPLRGNIGVRYEHTKQKVNGNITMARDALPLTDPRRNYTDVQLDIGDYTISQKYGNILPSLNLVLEPASKLQVRFAAAKVLVRPIMDSTTPMAQTQAYSSSTNTYSINLGQANLKALTANQLDLGVEWYYGHGSAITVAGFYKWIKNGTYSTLICPSSWQGTALSTNATGDCVSSSGAIYDITANLNDPSTIKLKGFEVSWNQSFDQILPVDGFGIMANFTRVYPQKLATGTGYTVRNLSKITWNLVPYWENEHFNIRASINHRSGYDQSNADSFFAREDHTVRARTQIDLSGGYSPNDRLSFSAGVLNLNNSREEAYKTDPSIWQESSFVGRNYYVSATFKL